MAILGYNTKGPNTQGFGANRMRLSKFTLASAQTLTELHGWFGAGGAGDTIRLIIYADSAGVPGARMAYTNVLALTGSDVELSQTGFSVALAAGDYWIGWYCIATAASGVGYLDSSTGTGYSFIGVSNPPPDPAPSGTGGLTQKFSVWAVVGASSTVGRFSRLKLGAGLSGTDLTGGVIQLANTVTAAPDATSSVKGLVQLAGDLAGTAASPQIAAGAVANADVAAGAGISYSKLGGAPAVRVTHNAAQAATGAAALVLAFNTERFDQADGAAAAMHDNTTNNSRLTCVAAGVYLIQAQLEFAANATGFRTCQLRLNGSTVIGNMVTMAVTTAAVGTRLQVSTIYALAAGDYVEVVVDQGAGVSLNVIAFNNYTPEFMMVRVG